MYFNHDTKWPEILILHTQGSGPYGMEVNHNTKVDGCDSLLMEQGGQKTSLIWKSLVIYLKAPECNGFVISYFFFFFLQWGLEHMQSNTHAPN